MKNNRFGTPLILLAFALMALLTTPSAQAWKMMGGGGGTENGGVLDTEERARLTQLNANDLEALVLRELPSRFKEIPQLHAFVNGVLYYKTWSLEPLALNEKCRNSVFTNETTLIIGCQNSYEIRIAKTWWDQATDRNRAAIVIHEALLAYYENTPHESEPVRIIVGSLFSADLAEQVHAQFLRNQFPARLLRAPDLRNLTTFRDAVVGRLCRGERVTLARDERVSEPYRKTENFMMNALTTQFTTRGKNCSPSRSEAAKMLLSESAPVFFWTLSSPPNAPWLASRACTGQSCWVSFLFDRL